MIIQRIYRTITLFKLLIILNLNNKFIRKLFLQIYSNEDINIKLPDIYKICIKIFKRGIKERKVAKNNFD